MANVSLNSLAQMDLVTVIDKNKDFKLQRGSEIQVSDEHFAQLDTDKNGELSTRELSNAMIKDEVIINYNSKDPASVRLNPVKFRTSTHDPARGHIYLGGLVGAGLGAGVGALVGPKFGASPRDAAGIGAMGGALLGTISGGVYTSLYGESKTTVSEIDPKTVPDPKVAKPYSLSGAAVGAALGAAAGYMVFGRTGLMGPKTAMFAGASMLATVGMGVGNAIGNHVSLKQKNAE